MAKASEKRLPFEGQWVGRAVLGGILIGTAAIVVLGIVFDVPKGMQHHGGFACLAAAFGGIVGASELISRYRDAPMRALATVAGASYVFLNAVVSGLTYGLLTRYADGLLPGLADDPLMTSIVAGFGAMAILRSKFFTLRTASGESIAVGPDAAISAFLDAADRGVDRARASSRLALVYKEASKVERPVDGPDFMEISIAALQNLSDEDKARFVKRIEAVQGSSYTAQLKLQALCYELLTLIGERNFSDLMANLQTYIRVTPAVTDAKPPPVAGGPPAGPVPAPGAPAGPGAAPAGGPAPAVAAEPAPAAAGAGGAPKPAEPAEAPKPAEPAEDPEAPEEPAPAEPEDDDGEAGPAPPRRNRR